MTLKFFNLGDYQISRDLAPCHILLRFVISISVATSSDNCITPWIESNEDIHEHYYVTSIFRDSEFSMLHAYWCPKFVTEIDQWCSDTESEIDQWCQRLWLEAIQNRRLISDASYCNWKRYGIGSGGTLLLPIRDRQRHRTRPKAKQALLQVSW